MAETQTKKSGKAWSVISTILVIVIVVLALIIPITRLFGVQSFTVLSGSMEPTYKVGSVVFVKDIPQEEILAGTPITFKIDEDTIVTHRVVGIVPDENDPTQMVYVTKGDANDIEDGGTVSYSQVIGTPAFSIPYLGYVLQFIQQPPGIYIVIVIIAALVLSILLPPLLKKDKQEKS